MCGCINDKDKDKGDEGEDDATLPAVRRRKRKKKRWADDESSRFIKLRMGWTGKDILTTTNSPLLFSIPSISYISTMATATLYHIIT